MQSARAKEITQVQQIARTRTTAGIAATAVGVLLTALILQQVAEGLGWLGG